MTIPRLVILAFILGVLGASVSAWGAESFEKPDVPAQTIKTAAPEFPDPSKTGLDQASVKLRFMIDAKGNVAGIEVVESDHELLTAAAVRAVNQWKYRPALKDGRPIPSMSRADFFVSRQLDDPFDDLPDIESLDRKPVAIHKVGPVYPPALVPVNVEGAVEALFVINERGKVTHIQIVKSDHPQFSQSATTALKKWRFSPGMLDGEPVQTRARIRFPFSIH